ncbi:MAG: hypothetical protein ACOYK8_07765 [Alphaproteobacteria bacterium]
MKTLPTDFTFRATDIKNTFIFEEDVLNQCKIFYALYVAILTNQIISKDETHSYFNIKQLDSGELEISFNQGNMIAEDFPYFSELLGDDIFPGRKHVAFAELFREYLLVCTADQPKNTTLVRISKNNDEGTALIVAQDLNLYGTSHATLDNKKANITAFVDTTIRILHLMDWRHQQNLLLQSSAQIRQQLPATHSKKQTDDQSRVFTPIADHDDNNLSATTSSSMSRSPQTGVRNPNKGRRRKQSSWNWGTLILGSSCLFGGIAIGFLCSSFFSFPKDKITERFNNITAKSVQTGKGFYLLEDEIKSIGFEKSETSADTKRNLPNAIKTYFNVGGKLVTCERSDADVSVNETALYQCVFNSPVPAKP